MEEETSFRLRRDAETLSAALLRIGSGGGGNEVKPETVHRGTSLTSKPSRCVVDFVSRSRRHVFWSCASASSAQRPVLLLVVLLFYAGLLLLFSWIGKTAAVFSVTSALDVAMSQKEDICQQLVCVLISRQMSHLPVCFVFPQRDVRHASDHPHLSSHEAELFCSLQGPYLCSLPRTDRLTVGLFKEGYGPWETTKLSLGS